MEPQDNHLNVNFGIINKPPPFTGVKQELEGFLTRAELAMESRPELFADDSSKIRFLMSYMLGKPLEWISCLRRNQSPLLNSYEEFLKGLRTNFGDYCVDSIVANSKLCSIKQRKIGHVFDYISEFQRTAQCSDFNESAKIYMFIKGLKYQLREKLAVVDPNPTSLNKVISDVLSIESLLNRSDVIERYTTQGERNSDPMDIDLFRIKRGQRNTRYFPSNKKLYNEEKKDFTEEKKKGLCFKCKQPGHRAFNCPNQIKPKGLKVIKKLNQEENNNQTVTVSSIRRIRKLEDVEVHQLREIKKEEENLPKERKNILEFYIKTNETEETKARVLIDSGSDLNFVHPGFLKYAKIKTEQIDHPFNVSGLGYGVSNVSKESEKCILRFKNHLETIKLHVLRIPDVDIILGLPWIEKHCPANYHDSKKITFNSGYCARHCNNGKRKRKNKKRTSTTELSQCNDITSLNEFDHPYCFSIKNEDKIEDLQENVIDSNNNLETPKFDFKVRAERTINDDSDSDSDLDDRFMFDYISDSELEDNLVDNIECNYSLKSCKKQKTCNETNNENLNKDKKLVAIPTQYLKYKEVFNEKNSNVLPPHRPYDCEIKLKDNSNLFYGPLYPLTEMERDELKNYLKENLEKGFIRKSTSPAGAPVLFVRKKDGSLRLCVDYRKLNDMTIRNSYPLPLISDMLDRVKGAKFFTKLDLKSAYNLVRIKEGDEYKTAFRTRYGHFEYLVMPFGLKNAPATFQHFINDVLSDYLDDFVISYIDDILIYSNSLEEHHDHVEKVLRKLLENGLFVKLEKCEFDVTETAFLGYVISKDGLKMDNEKINAILSWPVPTNVKEIQSFIGLCNYYLIFIKDFAKIAHPIHKLTRKNVPFIWSNEQQNAFDKLKHLFTSAPILVHPDSNKPFIVETDASNFAVGAILSQEHDGKIHPVAFLSKSLTKCQKNYQIYDKELLAIKVALEEWRHFLEGARHQFIVYTDHKNLTFPRKPEMLSQRQIRWYEFLSRFDFKLIYRSGKKSGKPDLLSRRSDHLFSQLRSISCVKINDFRNSNKSLISSILSSLNKDIMYKKFKKALSDNNSDSAFKTCFKNFTIDKEGFLLFNNLIYVPEPIRVRILELHHDSITAGHFGVNKTCELISRNFWWPKLSSDVKQFIKSCDICCQSKVPRHKPYGLLSPLDTPKRPWSDISMDFIVELPKSKDMTTIMVVVDRLTKMAHFIPLRCLPTASIAADAFIVNIFRLHGFPDSIISDRGSQFTSDFWNRLCSLLSINHSLSTANHPQTDGQTERVNGILEQYLRCFINEKQNNWADLLPFAEFSYNNTLQQSINQSPFFANYGYNPRFNLEIPSTDRPNRAEKRIVDIGKNIKFLKENLELAKRTYKKYADLKRMEAPEFEVGKKVWLLKGTSTKNKKRKLSNQLIGPFEIIRKVSPLAYELNLPNKMRCHPVFHVSLLEPYYQNEFKNRSNYRRKNVHLTPDLINKIPERIHDVKVVNGKKYYFMSWKGLGIDSNSWVEEGQVCDQQLIQEYYKRIRKGKFSAKHDSDAQSEYYVRHKYQPFFVEIPSRN